MRNSVEFKCYMRADGYLRIDDDKLTEELGYASTDEDVPEFIHDVLGIEFDPKKCAGNTFKIKIEKL